MTLHIPVYKRWRKLYIGFFLYSSKRRSFDVICMNRVTKTIRGDFSHLQYIFCTCSSETFYLSSVWQISRTLTSLLYHLSRDQRKTEHIGSIYQLLWLESLRFTLVLPGLFSDERGRIPRPVTVGSFCLFETRYWRGEIGLWWILWCRGGVSVQEVLILPLFP